MVKKYSLQMMMYATFFFNQSAGKYKVEVIVAMDGKHALEQIDQNPDVDVILMDMMMPKWMAMKPLSR
ncbi:response regulator [Chryseobacterium arthrosphaerae]|uniref:Response regulator n=1 Tax=Chryseobacterium arthrosphaerae TaxID=651561 RepID=A0A3S0PP26_9FLAO|nr:response regulator [Chryseobacterium arthrosphaerae]